MAVTAQQIADLAGVSRGTVDRALHNRGRVNPEVKEKIQKIALELGYKPNLIGQALVRSKQDFKLGVILQSTETPTMQVVPDTRPSDRWTQHRSPQDRDLHAVRAA